MSDPAPRRVVLVGEDDETIGDLLSTVINDEPGYNAVLVRNGAEALAAMSGAKFDLVLLDLVLPLFSGIEILDRIRADHTNYSVPVVVVSGSALEESQALRDRAVPAFVKKFVRCSRGPRARAGIRTAQQRERPRIILRALTRRAKERAAAPR